MYACTREIQIVSYVNNEFLDDENDTVQEVSKYCCNIVEYNQRIWLVLQTAKT